MKRFYIERVRKNVTVIERYEVEAETLEEAIANHDKHPDNLLFTHIWEKDSEDIIQNEPEGWKFIESEEFVPFVPEACELEKQKIREEQSKIQYSVNTNDWYFDITTECDVKAIGLSMEDTYLDDDLGSHNLPKEIAALLAPVGVLVECELCESMWEIDSDKTKDELIEEIKALGFNYSGIFSN